MRPMFALFLAFSLLFVGSPSSTPWSSTAAYAAGPQVPTYLPETVMRREKLLTFRGHGIFGAPDSAEPYFAVGLYVEEGAPTPTSEDPGTSVKQVVVHHLRDVGGVALRTWWETLLQDATSPEVRGSFLAELTSLQEGEQIILTFYGHGGDVMVNAHPKKAIRDPSFERAVLKRIIGSILR
jgi:hypothetical protein